MYVIDYGVDHMIFTHLTRFDKCTKYYLIIPALANSSSFFLRMGFFLCSGVLVGSRPPFGSFTPVLFATSRLEKHFRVFSRALFFLASLLLRLLPSFDSIWRLFYKKDPISMDSNRIIR